MFFCETLIVSGDWFVCVQPLARVYYSPYYLMRVCGRERESACVCTDSRCKPWCRCCLNNNLYYPIVPLAFFFVNIDCQW